MFVIFALRMYKFLVLLTLFGVASAEVVRFGKCNNYQNVNCIIKEVRITPCPEAANDKPCSIKRGKSANVEFDFISSGRYDNLQTKAYWAAPTGDLPWIGMDSDGCKHTTCPTEASEQTFTYNLDIEKKLPTVRLPLTTIPEEILLGSEKKNLSSLLVLT